MSKTVADHPNDNIDGLRLYQRRGFRLAALDVGAVDRGGESLKLEKLLPERA
jgi:hypothetical protein